MTKLIIFDFWGTLVDNKLKPSPTKQVKFLVRDKDPFPLFIVRFENAFMKQNFDSLNEAFKEVCQEFDTPSFVVEKLVGLWNKMSILSSPFDESLKVLDDLKKDYKLILLSNTDSFSIKQVFDKFDLEQYFDKVYLSCDTHILKTDPKIFDQIMLDFDMNKEDMIMVGDSIQSDIQGAMNAGIKGILVDRNDRRDFNPKIKNLEELRGIIENE